MYIKRVDFSGFDQFEMKFCLFAAFLVFVSVRAVKLPTNWAKCKNDTTMNECLRKAIQFSIRSLDKGNKTLGVYPLDPWKVKTFEYRQSSGPVAVNLFVRNVTVTGFRNSKIEQVKNDWETLEFVLKTAKLTLVGKYAMNGSIIFLPIEGKGNFRLVAEDFTTKIKLFFEKFNKKGKEFLRVKNAHFTPDAVTINSRFDNLFNGNKALGDRMNDVINNNWKLILETIQPLTTESLGEPVKIVANGLFSRVPAKEFII